MELTILMPCLNEAETLSACVLKARAFLENENIQGEILIADNGSTDGSQEIASAHGARVVPIPVRGYGAALMGGIQAAQGKYIIMGDADDSYDFLNLMPFLAKLREGYELVMGNRFKGGIMPGAMPPLHKYLGNPVLTGIGRLFFKSGIKDFHCGLRGFHKSAIEKLGLQTSGMEFASEMVVKATLNKLKIIEVPTVLSKDGRSRPPHLRSWRDGWRHLRFLLIFSPRWLFLYPGFVLSFIGLLGMLALVTGPVKIGEHSLDINTMLYFGMFTIIGLQAVFFALFAKVFSMNSGFVPRDKNIIKLLNLFSLERGLIIGVILTLAGIFGTLLAFLTWKNVSFGSLNPLSMMRLVIPSGIALALGIQIIFGSFFLSVLGLNYKTHNE